MDHRTAYDLHRRQPVVVRLGAPVLEANSTRQRFALVKLGRTREQLLIRGVTARDLRAWTRAGYVEWST